METSIQTMRGRNYYHLCTKFWGLILLLVLLCAIAYNDNVQCKLQNVTFAKDDSRFDEQDASLRSSPLVGEDLYKDHTRENEAKIMELIESMSVEEKVGQMLQLDVHIFIEPGTNNVNMEKLKEIVSKYKVGSILNAPCSEHDCVTTVKDWKNIINAIQGAVLNKSGGGNGIPILYGIDTVHGAQYVHGAAIFPQQLATASSFNTSHSYVMGVTGAKDTRAAGIPWVFSPILGVSSHALWPRNYETFGEDPLLVTEMGKAVINGYQGVNGSGLNTTEKVAACMKHFVGYPYPLNGMDRGPVRIPDSELMNIYVPSFEGAVEVNVASAMSGYHTLNDEPLGGSPKYLKTLLRDVMGFSGMMVTDYGVIEELTSLHHMVETLSEAISLSLDSSVDMSMAGWNPEYFDELVGLVRKGHVLESRLDDAVKRILRLKSKVGWNLQRYDQPNWFGNADSVGSSEDWNASLESARDSVILTKNENNILPLNANENVNVLFTGPAVRSCVWQSGGWSIHWTGGFSEEDFPQRSTAYDFVKDAFDSYPVSLSYSVGLHDDYADHETTVAEAVAKAKLSDVVVVGIGERPYVERGGNTDVAELDSEQQNLVREIQKVCQKVILVLFEGRPRVLDRDIVENAMGVLVSFYPGPMGGQAVGEILFGRVNPSAAMPLTYPASAHQIPYRYWHKWSYSAQIQNRGEKLCTVECFGKPLYEFGHGLSYSTFTFRNLRTDRELYENSKGKLFVEVSVDVKNTGRRRGKVPVLLFVRDVFRKGAAPETKLLKAFTKIELSPGEETTVNFGLNRRAFEFHTNRDAFGESVIENGKFILECGDIASGRIESTQIRIEIK
eukprot:Nk52_evm74s210 gene=Nk52_evmTU74s210